MMNVSINYKYVIHGFFILFSLMFILPFLLIITTSLTGEAEILSGGYTLFPSKIDLTSYKFVFSNPTQILNSYQVTAFVSVVGTALGVLVMSLVAYPLSRTNFSYKEPVTFFIFFTMLFSGGLIPSYILVTQYLGLGNTIWVYILPTLASPWHIMILRTFFKSLPYSLVESAKIDGGKEALIFFKIILPLSKPVIATIALLTLLVRWNDWFTTLIYIRDSNLYTLGYLLQRILREAEFVRSVAKDLPAGIDFQGMNQTPTEGMRFAMVIVAAGPMLFVFPFFQKYFTRGLTIGAVKG